MEKTAVFTAPITTGTRNTRWSIHQGRVPRKKSILGTQTLNGQQRGKKKQQQDWPGVGRKVGRNPAEGGASESRKKDLKF